MKKLILLSFLISISIFGCKKEEVPSLYGTWLSTDKGTQFTIDNLEGKGKQNFVLDGDILTWKLNEITKIYKVVHINKSTLTLNENGVDIHFMRFR
ncbi:hypothetical protein [Pedobacter agri]|uniref:hypothetical protein n=1 Tax=Pedobacter agri TaxID=454586 RepID=UPI00292DF18E|nr:hypothetical protein [Pedobacter agri]